MRKMVLALALAASVSAQPRPALSPALSIDNFDYSAVMTSVQAIFGNQQNIGQGINAMLTRRIAQDGRFMVVERRKVNEVLREQDFDASSRVKQGTGARRGQIRGANLTLAGDIVVFGRDDRRIGGGAGGATYGAGAAAGGYGSSNKAVVVLDYRIIDVETSQVVASGEARGESKRTSGGAGAAFLSGRAFGGGAINMSSANFAETIIGEATLDAVNQLAEQIRTVNLIAGAGNRSADLDARVADVTGNSIIINAGAGAGLAPGQTFTVYRQGKEIKDPTTGDILDVQTTPIGKLTLTAVRERIAEGNFTGTAQPVVGDVVRK